jgi:hypothetical protein
VSGLVFAGRSKTTSRRGAKCSGGKHPPLQGRHGMRSPRRLLNRDPIEGIRTSEIRIRITRDQPKTFCSHIPSNADGAITLNSPVELGSLDWRNSNSRCTNKLGDLYG